MKAKFYLGNYQDWINNQVYFLALRDKFAGKEIQKYPQYKKEAKEDYKELYQFMLDYLKK